jgi:hypothetical protein
MSRTPLLVSVALLIATTPLLAQSTAPYRPLGTLRQQAQLQQLWLEQRLETVLPELMREQGIEMWVVSMREYNEDPVFPALVSATTFAARRRTIYIFHDRGPGDGVDRIALGGSSQGGLYEALRGTLVTEDGRREELTGDNQWNALATLVRERNPRNIAVNMSNVHAFSDGLTAAEWEQMREALGPDLANRVVRAELLPLNLLYLRVPGMFPVFRQMQELVWDLISTAFSNEVIMPGVTTTDDVVWWMRQRINDMGLQTWFHPSVDVQRQGGVDSEGSTIIHRGDVLHCDVGITALGLNTDTQHLGYVLRDYETDVPEGLKAAMRNGNRLQDILLAEMLPGRTGTEALLAALAQMREAGINGTIYTHPVGDNGHAAGPLIGRWDNQAGVPGRGDVPLRGPSWYAIELQATTPVPEWSDQPVRMAMEEDAELTTDGTMHWILARQTEFHLVR